MKKIKYLESNLNKEIPHKIKFKYLFENQFYFYRMTQIFQLKSVN